MLNAPRRGVEWWLGEVDNHLPDSAEYGLIRGRIENDTGEMVFRMFDPLEPWYLSIDATNLPERGTAGGAVEPGTVVHVFQSQLQTGFTQYWFDRGGVGAGIEYGLVRSVVSDFELIIHRVTLTDDPRTILVDDEDLSMRPAPGVLGSWFIPLVWVGPPTVRANYPELQRVNGFPVVSQNLKHELILPPDPNQFPPGLCMLGGG